MLDWLRRGGLWLGLGMGQEMTDTLHVFPHLGNHAPQDAVLLLQMMDLFRCQIIYLWCMTLWVDKHTIVWTEKCIIYMLLLGAIGQSLTPVFTCCLSLLAFVHSSDLKVSKAIFIIPCLYRMSLFSCHVLLECHMRQDKEFYSTVQKTINRLKNRLFWPLIFHYAK